MSADDDWYDAVPCGLLQTTDEGAIRRVNATFCNWLGYSAGELVDQRRFQELLTVGGRIFHYTHWEPLLRMQGSVSEVKLDLVHRDGGTFPVVFNAVRRDTPGGVLRDLALYIARDRDRYEQELVRSRRKLEEAVAETERLHKVEKDRAQSAEQMIGIVSHDLRNPLGAIVMGAELLSRGEMNEAQARVVGRIRSASDRATHLIDDLLDFTAARLGSGLAVDRRLMDLHAVIAEALEDLRLAYPARSLVHVREGAGETSGDARRLVQALGNLVSNAVAYGDPAEPITVTTAIVDGECKLVVHNRGPAIPADAQSGLFEPMQRGTTAGAKRSVGLGLFIVREIARAHAGTASVSSDAERGTRFELRWS